METVTDFLFLGSKITADGYCSHEIKRRLLLGRKAMTVQFSFSVVSDSLWPHGLQHPGFPVHHQLPELAQTHVHQVGDAIHHLILCRPFLLPPSIFPSIRVFSNESALHIRWPKFWSFSFSISPSNEYSGLISFRMDSSPRDSQEPSPTPQFKSINSSALRFLYSSTLTSIHDH